MWLCSIFNLLCKSKMEKVKEQFKQYGGNTPLFTLNGTKCWGRIVNLYDGDTFKVIIKIFDNYYKINMRMCAIDTCEIKSKDEANKKKAIQARNRILQLVCPEEDINLDKNYTKKEIDAILNKHVCMVWVNLLEFDKYGRTLCDVYNTPDSESFSKILISEKLGYEYFGDTKLTEDQQKETL